MYAKFLSARGYGVTTFGILVIQDICRVSRYGCLSAVRLAWGSTISSLGTEGWFLCWGRQLSLYGGGCFPHRGLSQVKLPRNGRSWGGHLRPCQAVGSPVCPFWECYGRCHAQRIVGADLCHLRGEYVSMETANLPLRRRRACDEPREEGRMEGEHLLA